MPAVGYALLLGAMLTWAVQLGLAGLAIQQAPIMGFVAAVHAALLARWALGRAAGQQRLASVRLTWRQSAEIGERRTARGAQRD